MPLRLSQLAPGVHRLHTRYTNWYLLEEGGRLTVLDAGRGPHTENADLAVQSLEILASTNAAIVLPGHGEPWPHGVKSAVDIAQQPA